MRVAALLCTLLVVVTGVGATAGTVSANAQVSVTNVTVTPEQPSPGERFTLVTTVRNAGATANAPSGSFEINDVIVRTARGGRQLARVEDVGTLPAGSDIRIPLTTSFDETGVKDLRVEVIGESGSDVIALQYPAVVTVRDGGPQLSTTTDDPVVGAASPFDVTVANGEDAPVRNVRVELDGTAASADDPTRVVPSLSGGETRTFAFNVTPAEADASVTTTLSYTTSSGDRRSVTETTPIVAEPLREDVALDADVAGGGVDPPVSVELSNFGNAPVEDVLVRAAADGRTVGRTTAGDVAAESTRTVRVNVSGVDAADLTVTADYVTGSRSGSASTSVRYEPSPGRIELTGVDYEVEGDRVLVSGSASNVGLSQADSVLVRTMSAEGVEPVRPNREFFVGTVPRSDFASFELSIDLTAGATTIPVEVTYLVDGERRRTVQELDVSDVSAPAEREGRNAGGGGSGGSDGLGLPIVALGVLALLVVAGVGIYAYRNR